YSQKLCCGSCGGPVSFPPRLDAGNCHFPLQSDKTALRFRLVQIVERIVQRHASDAAEPGLLAKLANFRFMKTECAQSCTIVRKRRGHAIEHAYAMKHRAERIRVLLELVGAVDVETNVDAAWPKRSTNRLQQLKWVDCIMHDIERGDHIKLRRQSFRDIARFETDPI